MKKYLLGITIMTLALCTACVKSIDKMDISGILLEKSTLTPIAGVVVTLTDGNQNYATSVTSQDGMFTLKNVSFDELIRCYLFCNATTLSLPSRMVHIQRKIIGHKKYNLGHVYLYDKSQQANYNNLPTFTYAGKTYKVAFSSEEPYSWNDANEYCSNLELYYSDWRMPTYAELIQMYNDRISIGGFNDTECYWSSTPSFDDESCRYVVDFYDGHTHLVHCHGHCHVRPIRVEN